MTNGRPPWAPAARGGQGNRRLLEAVAGLLEGVAEGFPGALGAVPQVVPGVVAGLAQLLELVAHLLALGLEALGLLLPLDACIGLGAPGLGPQLVDLGLPLVQLRAQLLLVGFPVAHMDAPFLYGGETSKTCRLAAKPLLQGGKPGGWP